MAILHGLDPRTPAKNGPPARFILLLSIVFAASFWTIDTWHDSTSSGSRFRDHLLPLDPLEFGVRLAVVALILLSVHLSSRRVGAARASGDRGIPEAECRHASIFDNFNDSIVLYDRGGNIQWANRAALGDMGRGLDEVIDKPCRGTRLRAAQPCVPCLAMNAIESGIPQEGDTMIPDGRTLHIKAYPCRDDAGEITGAIEVSIDISSRIRADEALASEKERLMVTLQSIGDGVIVTDRDGMVTFVNRVAEQYTGWPQLEAGGVHLDEVFRVVDENTRGRAWDPVRLVRETMAPVSLEGRCILISRDGSERCIADCAAPIRDGDGNLVGIVLVFQDVTEKRRREQESLKSQELESLGVLAGGIAHDFNNILTAILGSTSLARMSAQYNELDPQALADIERAAQRAKGLARQLLAFAKGSAPMKISISLKPLLREAAEACLAGSGVAWTLDLPPDLWNIEAEAEQIDQVVHNVLANGREALQGRGTIHISCENVEAGGAADAPAPQRHVRLSIRDTGPGIRQEDIPRIFDPYFTTKSDHSGLGLSAAYFLVKKHGGNIDVESPPGLGTTFHILLPASTAQPDHPAEQGIFEDIHGRAGRILVMDDEEIVRSVVGRILGKLGYETDFAQDGSQAIEKYRAAMASGKPFDAVIMDLTIPRGMGGVEAIRHLLEHDPGARAIVSSGYSNDPIAGSYTAHGFKGFIAKPFLAEDLQRVLRSVLRSDRKEPPRVA